MKPERCSPGKVVELRPEQLFEYLAGRLVLMDVPSIADSPGPMGELVGVGLTERPFERLGHFVLVDSGQPGQSEAFGLVDQFGVGYEHFAEQAPAFVAGELIKGGSGWTASSGHGSGHTQPGGRLAGNGGRQSQVR